MKPRLFFLALLVPGAFAQAQDVHFVLQPNSPLTGTANAHPFDLAVADVNGDGRPDVLTANYTDRTVGVLLGDGQGGFVLQPNQPKTGGNMPLPMAWPWPT